MSDLSSAEEVGSLERFGVGNHPPCPCGVMLAECVVPVGDESVPACWVCAHDYVEHDRPIGSASGVPCECKLDEVYPPDVLSTRRLRAASTSPA